MHLTFNLHDATLIRAVALTTPLTESNCCAVANATMYAIAVQSIRKQIGLRGINGDARRKSLSLNFEQLKAK